MNYRTDLAYESKQLYDEEKGEETDIDGVTMDKTIYDEEIQAIKIKILNENGEKALGKPKGSYITLEIKGLSDVVINEVMLSGLKMRAARALSNELKNFVKFYYNLKVLIVGLGNDKVTPDALGPYTASKVKITRHLFIMYEAEGDEEMTCVSGFIPGVTGSTGMETAELIKKAVEVTKPEVVIVIDSLAARDINRISTTIQINDTGISPGSGMGNVRTMISDETLGCKVIAIGVPTVIDSRTLVLDTLRNFEEQNKEPNCNSKETNCDSKVVQGNGDMFDKFVKDNGQDMIVTSTDIDQVIKDFSDIIANGINITLHPGIYS